jgi:hypothetical protein
MEELKAIAEQAGAPNVCWSGAWWRAHAAAEHRQGEGAPGLLELDRQCSLLWLPFELSVDLKSNFRG